MFVLHASLGFPATDSSVSRNTFSVSVLEAWIWLTTPATCASPVSVPSVDACTYVLRLSPTPYIHPDFSCFTLQQQYATVDICVGNSGAGVFD